MPYANFDDVQSLKSLYAAYLQEDNDMDLLEFIGEKILTAGLIKEEDANNLPAAHHKTLPQSEILQIHTGVLFQQTHQEIVIQKPDVSACNKTAYVNGFFSGEFYKRIFHPPLLNGSIM